jgi:hypothetical protein
VCQGALRIATAVLVSSWTRRCVIGAAASFPPFFTIVLLTMVKVPLPAAVAPAAAAAAGTATAGLVAGSLLLSGGPPSEGKSDWGLVSYCLVQLVRACGCPQTFPVLESILSHTCFRPPGQSFSFFWQRP